MEIDEQVLGAMLRLARHRRSAEDSEVALRVDGTAAAVRASLRRLRSAGLVELRRELPARLTLPGLACAVALASRRVARAHGAMRRASRAA